MASIDVLPDHGRAPGEEPPRYSAPRYGSSAVQTALDLGPLASLPGSWKGTGFSVMWRPNNDAAQPGSPAPIKRYLMLNKTADAFDFHAIPGQVPNRGLQQDDAAGNPIANVQNDIDLYGLHYLQRVSDDDKSPFLDAGQALHIEPGLFMYVPANDNSQAPGYRSEDTIVRMGSIPHGVTVLMQGKAPSPTPVPGPPDIPDTYPNPALPAITKEFNPPNPAVLVPPAGGNNIVGLGIQPVDTTPAHTEHSVPEVRISNDVPNPPPAAGTVQSNGPYPHPHEFQRIVDNPNSVLQDVIAHQEILGSITIKLSTHVIDPGIAQIPFLGVAKNSATGDGFKTSLTNNCYVERADATFWLEWVRAPGEPSAYGHRGPFGQDGEGNCLHLDPTRDGPSYLQLQYSQTVVLVFNKVAWPHITVATLRLSNG